MFKDKLKGLINPEDGNKNNKKKIENLIFFVVILIVTIVIINIIWNGDKDSSNDKGVQNDTSKQLANSNTSSLEVSSNSTNELEVKLEEILSKIQGVGEVKVFINYSESSEIIPMYNGGEKGRGPGRPDGGRGRHRPADGDRREL